MKKTMKKLLISGITLAIACSLYGGVKAQDSIYEYGMSSVTIEDGVLKAGDAIHNDAAVSVGTTLETNQVNGASNQWYGHFFFGNAEITNTTFDGNTLQSAGPNGGAVYFNSSVKFSDPTYEVEIPNQVTVKDSAFINNKITSTGTTGSINDTSKAGAVFIKGTNVTFDDVRFNNNIAEGGANATAAGGAVYLDSTSNTANHDGVKRVLKASATFNVTKDTTYSGNNVTGSSDSSYTYGSYLTTDGGFMYMDRGAEANFNIADGATLKIGEENATGNMDSIASAIRGANTEYGENVINKNGAGTLTVNGSMSGYHGNLNVNEGTMNINQNIAGDAQITVKDGATLNLKDVELNSQNISNTFTYVKPDGSTATIALPERNGQLIAAAGSTVMADSITANGKSAIKVDENAKLTANSIFLSTDAELKTEKDSQLNISDAVKLADKNSNKISIKGNFSGKVTDTTGTALTASELAKVFSADASDKSQIDLLASDSKTSTSFIQGNDGSLTIQGKTFDDNGDATSTAFGVMDNKGNYDAKGHDLQNVGTVSAEKLQLGQIGDVETAISKNTDNIDALDSRIDQVENNIANNAASIGKLDKKIDKVGANAAALAALHPLDFDASDKWSFAAGVGNYSGENAMAVGAFYRPNEDVMFNVAGSFGGGENMVNAGVSLKLGQHGTKTIAKVNIPEVKELQEIVKAQNEKLTEQERQIQELREMVEKLAAKA